MIVQPGLVIGKFALWEPASTQPNGQPNGFSETWDGDAMKRLGQEPIIIKDIIGKIVSKLIPLWLYTAVEVLPVPNTKLESRWQRFQPPLSIPSSSPEFP